MKRIIAILVVGLCILGIHANPKYIYMNINQMESYKKEVNGSNASAYKDLIESANKELKKGPYSVTYKKIAASSGDKHDYMSLAPYWWPNPDTADGMPWVRRDGQVNPETRKQDKTDQVQLSDLCNAVNTLGTAYFYSDDEKYAQYAATLLKVFFVDEETKMTPRLLYGQYVPGMNEGRMAGLIEMAGLPGLLAGAVLIQKSKHWTKECDEGFNKWMTAYLEWNLTHPFAIGERSTKANHATHHDRQVVSMMMYLGKYEDAKAYLKKYSYARAIQQIEADGSQPHELGRTKSFNYTVMNLKGFYNLAQMSENLGMDFWNYKNDNGQVMIKSAMDWFIPYLELKKKWDHQQIIDFDMVNFLPLLVKASEKYNTGKYVDMIPALKSLNDKIIMPANYNFSSYNYLMQP